MQDAPTAADLLRSVADLLTDEVLPVVDDDILTFRLRVAVNALTIVARETEAAAVQIVEEVDRLRALLDVHALAGPTATEVEQDRFATARALNQLLVQRIQDGDVPTGALTHLIRTEIDRLEIASPKYLARTLNDPRHHPALRRAGLAR